MTEAAQGSSGTVAGESTAGPSAGALVRQARQAAGMHIAALAVALKVPVAKLEALESDRYDALPDAVFTRALASSMCRVLKVDPQPVLSRLPRASAHRLSDEEREGPQSVFHAQGESRRVVATPRPRGGSRLVPYAVLVLAVGALAMVFWPQISHTDWMTAYWPARQDSQNVSQETVVSENGTEVAAAAASVESRAADNAEKAPLLSAASSVVRDTAAVPPPALAASATAGTTSGLPTDAGMVAFSAKGSSWVKVTDASGKVVFQKTLNAGETGSASGTPPLKVIVGRADLTDVQVRGQPFSFAGVKRADNTARFEVK
jgi:cytoskeleton protein RodZ